MENAFWYNQVTVFHEHDIYVVHLCIITAVICLISALKWGCLSVQNLSLLSELKCYSCWLSFCVITMFFLRHFKNNWNFVFKRPFSYHRYWTGTGMQVRLVWGIFSNANDISLFLMIFSHISVHCKLAPVQYRIYEYMVCRGSKFDIRVVAYKLTESIRKFIFSFNEFVLAGIAVSCQYKTLHVFLKPVKFLKNS